MSESELADTLIIVCLGVPLAIGAIVAVIQMLVHGIEGLGDLDLTADIRRRKSNPDYCRVPYTREKEPSTERTEG